jgi:hypothetical protein
MFGNIAPTEMTFLLILGVVYLVLPIIAIVVTIRWARRVRIALEQIAANTAR